MADLLALLSQASASLAAQRGAAATAGHNLQNANTPGYARQSAQLEAVVPAEFVGGAFLGRGAALGAVTQARDRFLESQIPAALGDAASSKSEADALAALTALDPGADSGPGSALSRFYSDLRGLSQNPGDMGLRQAFVASAKNLARSFNGAAAEVAANRTGLDGRVAGSMGEVNSLATQVAALNREIRTARASGAEPNDLLDQRQLAADRLAELVGARPVPDSDGNVNLALPSGESLVSADLAGSLSTRADPANGGHLQILVTRPDGSGPSVAGTAGGSVGGAIAARDGALKTAGDRLDTLAFELGNALNAVHRAGFALDGSTGRDLFTVPGAVGGAAAALSVNAAVAGDPRLVSAASTAAGVPGDGANLAGLLGTETALLPSGFDPVGALSDLTAQFGASAARAQAAFLQDGAIKDHLSTMRESVSGVSIDEEVVNMQKFQRGFEAVTKVIQAASDMLDTLMQLK